MSFNSVLRELRLQDGLTQGDLADKLGVAKSTISMWESGERKPSFEMLEAIADFFNVNMSTLWGEDQKGSSGLSLPTSGNTVFQDSGLRLPTTKTPASVSADGIRERVANLPPELQELFLRFVQLALKSPEKASRYLAFVCQELESDQ